MKIFFLPDILAKIILLCLIPEIDRLYKKTGETAVLPNYAPKYFNVDKERVDLNSVEYVKFAKRQRGKKSFEYANGIIKNANYNSLADVDKSKVIATAYEYAGAKAKTEVSEYKLDGWYSKVERAEKAGISVDDYLIFRQLLPETPTNSEVALAAQKANKAKSITIVSLYYAK